MNTPANFSAQDSKFQGQKPKRRLTRQQMRWWIIGISVVLTSIALALLVFVLGSVSGKEFSPDTFRRRDFSFYEIPFLEIQITPIQRRITNTSITTPTITPGTPSQNISSYLRNNQLIERSNNPDPTWHLVHLYRGGRSNVIGDAEILVSQLDVTRNYKFYWEQWSKDHPSQATILWPLIQRLAKRELYLLMPGLFEIAQREQSDEELQQQIDQYLISQYQSLISDAVVANQTSLVDLLMEEATADFPQVDFSTAKLSQIKTASP